MYEIFQATCWIQTAKLTSNTSTVNLRTQAPKSLGYDPTSNSPQLEDASVQMEIPKKTTPHPKNLLEGNDKKIFQKPTKKMP